MSTSGKLSLDAFKRAAVSNLNLDSKLGGKAAAATTPLCPAKEIWDILSGDNDCH